jgi:hypothetical protein
MDRAPCPDQNSDKERQPQVQLSGDLRCLRRLPGRTRLHSCQHDHRASASFADLRTNLSAERHSITIVAEPTQHLTGLL